MPNFDQGTAAGSEWDLGEFLARERCPADSGIASTGRSRRRPGGGPERAASGGSAGLTRTIEGEIIPRLVLAQRAAASVERIDGNGPLVLDLGHTQQLADLLVKQDASVAIAYVEAIRAQGTSLGSIYLDLLAPTARRLGELWHEDRCSFFEVTLGLCALHQLLRRLAPNTVRGTQDAKRERRILLIPAPGEQHTFGLIMVGEFFRRSGWEVWLETPETVGDLSRLVRGEWFAIVGMSVGCSTPLKGVAPAILSARRASCNRALGVMVGGSLVNARPELVSLMGADATAGDGQRAVQQAEGVIRLLASEN
jgi:MerR family transcriptional regulator, light-induced transcriptional regulator